MTNLFRIWLKQTVYVLPPALLPEPAGPGRERAATKSSSEALEAMKVFWRRIWDRDALPEELQRLRSQQLSGLPGAPMSGSWKLGPEKLLRAARKKSSESCGQTAGLQQKFVTGR